MKPDDGIEQLARWCKSLSFVSDSAKLKQRLSAVQSLIADANCRDVINMILIILNLGSIPLADIERLRAFFKKTDDGFIAQYNDNEFVVLMAATLVFLSKENSNIGNFTALSICTAFCENTRKSNLDFDLSAIAENSMNARSIINRTRKPIKFLTESRAVTFTPVTDASTPESFNKAFSQLVQNSNESANKINTEFKTLVNQIGDYLIMQDEELQTLWWLIGERSWTLNRAFDKITKEAKPIVLAKELSDLTNILPGHTNLIPLLAKAGVATESVSIVEAVNACDISWLTTIQKEIANSHSVIVPIHSAISRRLELGDTVAWIPGWEAASKISSKARLTELGLAKMFYQESLSLRLGAN